MTHDKMITAEDLKGLLRAKVTVAPSLRACARNLEVSAAYLSKILTTPGAAIGPHVVDRLGYEAVTMYRKLSKRKGK